MPVEPPPVEADAIVVLGCAVRTSGLPSAPLARRIALAARAYHAGVAGWVVVSGGRRWGPHVEAVVMRRELIAAGVPEAAVLTELCSTSTLENGFYVQKILRALGAERVMVATCDWHMPRAQWIFARRGVATIRPPLTWLKTPPPSFQIRVREWLCVCTDWCMMLPTR